MKDKTFKVMVTFPNLLEERINAFNKFHNTEFELVETLYDEVPFCIIKYNAESEKYIFNLGFGLAVKQYKLKEEGKLDW